MRFDHRNALDAPVNAIVRRTYDQHKDIIIAGKRWFVDVGNSLMAIRDERLYLAAGFKTFEECVLKEFGMGKAYAHRLIESVVVIRDLSPIGDNLAAPQNESQARAVAASAPDAKTRAVVWHAAVELAPKDANGNSRITAAVVKKAASQINGTKAAKCSSPNGHSPKLPGTQLKSASPESESGGIPMWGEALEKILELLAIFADRPAKFRLAAANDLRQAAKDFESK